MIKFRAWDVLARKMIRELLLISYVRNEIIGKYENVSNSIPLKIREEAILMQSTGLFDKNGKEIFEGDIVKVTDGDERTDFSEGGIGTICGLDELYMWYIDGQVQNGLFDINQEYYIDVIGNIYQNQELLEVKE